MTALIRRLRALTPAQLAGMRRGLEKESLRALPNGALALTPHPAALGSALTHAHITTDYSESQLELITGAAWHGLKIAWMSWSRLHQFVYRSLGTVMRSDEMPVGVAACLASLPGDDDHSAGAQYGNSNVGRAKTRVSHGPWLSLRPAHANHFRHSLQLVLAQRSAASSTSALIRNFRRHAFCAAVPLWRISLRCVRELCTAGRQHHGCCKRAQRAVAAPCICPMPRLCAWDDWGIRVKRSPRWL